MGLLEEILEVNRKLSEQISNIQDEMFAMRKEFALKLQEKSVSKNIISLNFMGKDKLNSSMAAKVIGITQTELFEIVKRGRLRSIGEKKRIFYAEEVIRYMQKDTKPEHKNDISKIKQKKERITTKMNDIINTKELNELLSKQTA